MLPVLLSHKCCMNSVRITKRLSQKSWSINCGLPPCCLLSQMPAAMLAPVVLRLCNKQMVLGISPERSATLHLAIAISPITSFTLCSLAQKVPALVLRDFRSSSSLNSTSTIKLENSVSETEFTLRTSNQRWVSMFHPPVKYRWVRRNHALACSSEKSTTASRKCLRSSSLLV